jgi:DNA-nicking Smr family endonuclease
VASVVDEYLTACRERGILQVRIAHGKGIGVLRETVHALLARRDDVESFRLDSETGAGWGATLATLRPLSR